VRVVKRDVARRALRGVLCRAACAFASTVAHSPPPPPPQLRLQIQELSEYCAKAEGAHKRAVTEAESVRREAERQRRDLEKAFLEAKEEYRKLAGTVGDLRDDKEALLKKNELNMDALTNIGRRLEAVMVEKGELEEQVGAGRHRIAQVEKEKGEYKEKVSRVDAPPVGRVLAHPDSLTACRMQFHRI
jgi:hypothetical protein